MSALPGNVLLENVARGTSLTKRLQIGDTICRKLTDLENSNVTDISRVTSQKSKGLTDNFH